MSEARSALGIAYLDSSALVKLVVVELESAALRQAIAPWNDTCNERDRTRRGAAGNPRRRNLGEPRGAHPRQRRDDPAQRFRFASARTLQPPELRSLDAIHIASAGALGHNLGVLVTYDRRMQRAATAAGIAVLAPE